MLALLLALPLTPAASASPSGNGADFGVDFGPASALRGCQARMEVDIGLDARVDWTWLYRFDDDGRLVAVDGRAAKGNGSPQMRYRYDPLGQLAVQTWDGDADGVVDKRTTYVWGPEGLERSFEQSDLPSQTWYVVDDGRVVRIERDLDDDGALDTASTQRWRDDRVVQVDVDEDDDGVLDATTYYTYDRRGRLDTTRYDVGADGFVDRESAEVWGDDDRLIARLRDDDADGVPDSRTTIDWACPAS